jgi:hypothetical protein
MLELVHECPACAVHFALSTTYRAIGEVVPLTWLPLCLYLAVKVFHLQWSGYGFSWNKRHSRSR